LTWRDFQIYENNVRQRIAFSAPMQCHSPSRWSSTKSLDRDTMTKVNESLRAIQGGFTASDEIAVFTYADGVNNPTDFTAALSARVPAVLAQSKKEGDSYGPPITGARLPAAPPSTAGRLIRISTRSGQTPASWSIPKKSTP
jgi:hypothetical protein